MASKDKTHLDNYQPFSGKKQILIVEDEWINRELLRAMLEDEYEILVAEDGDGALSVVREKKETLSLILLDLIMPDMNGKEVLRILKEDPTTQSIPVIVLTADQAAEVESLDLGAVDFIPKPYPQREVILARVHRTIELCEDRQILSVTERDALTGLYNKEFFYQYVEKLDALHPDVRMDAIVLDINHFHIINDRFGMTFGDAILRKISDSLLVSVRPLGGIVCRREADVFMIYCPNGSDYRAVLDHASAGLATDGALDNHVRLRMGVYSDVDKSVDVIHRFDRAKIASDTIRGNAKQVIGLYDEKIREKELFAERLVDDFREAIRTEQFTVFFQPKYNITSQKPALSSAEALVRWKHPTLGMISPGIFIPLFEENGLIQELDKYIWKKTAQQIRKWKDEIGFSVPVSVNVSRVDLYDPGLLAYLEEILRENGITTAELLLEITESAYTEDAEQIIQIVKGLREHGFKIEMDDFGTGYSSLNMISNLPIDVLKLDMIFIRTAFKAGKDTRIIEVIIDIARYLNVPVVAEGVETEDQYRTLKALGVQIIQG
ncbi:MAG: EAL domain-containing protein, partial [Clostridia bacterium]|nr:EAL domain-containing protein [Clostridia bacterium]